MWSAQEYEPEKFPNIAATCLERSKLLTDNSLDDITGWLLAAQDGPPQKLRPFGNPPITLLETENYFIEALLFKDGVTGIHEHAFAGAFGVLEGNSLHVRYRFDADQALGDECFEGTATLLGAELLRRGNVRAIPKGNALTHSLYHLDRPTVSVVVRTRSDPTYVQHQILFPNLLVRSFMPEPDATIVAVMRFTASLEAEAFFNYFDGAMQRLTFTGRAELAYMGMSLNPDRTLTLLHQNQDWTRFISSARRQAETQWLFSERDTFREEPRRFAYIFSALANVPDDAVLREIAHDILRGEQDDDVYAFIESYFQYMVSEPLSGSIATVASAFDRGEHSATPNDPALKKYWADFLRTPLSRLLRA